MKRWRLILAAYSAGAAVADRLAGARWVYSLGPPPLGKDLETSHIVLDRDGRLLRAYATSDGRWRLPATEKDVDPRFLRLLFAYEDKRFYEHHGVDPMAMARAAIQFAGSGHIVSGGSTLTMQVARLLEPRQHRSFGAKLRQIARALELEYALSKDEILSLYLTLAPYGGNLEGIRAASLAYFGKEPRRLSLGEAALLVALPQSPELRRPDRYPEAARAARDRVLDRVAAAGVVPRDEIARAKFETVPRARKAIADAGAACRRSGRRRGAGDAAFTGSPSTQPCRRPWKTSRASARVRWGPTFRSPSSRSTMRAAKCARALPPPIISMTRRAGQVDMTQCAALARLDLEAVHLRPRLRGRLAASGNADRRPAGALRQLHAGEFRSDVPGHGHRAPRAAIVAQRSRHRGARQSRRQSPERAAHASRRRAGAAERRSAGSRHGPRRRRHQADPIW